MAFSISALCLITTFLLAGSGAFLLLNTRSRWGRGLAVLTATFPNWAIAASWLGVVAVTNALARQRVGAGLYGYGRFFTALIAFAFECSVVALVLSIAHRWGRGALPASGRPAREQVL